MSIIDLSKQSLWVLYGGICSSLLLLWALYPYMLTEFNTTYFEPQLNAHEFCKNELIDISEKLKYAKTVSFDSERNAALVYCIYTDSSLNTSFELEKQNAWKAIFAIKLNKDSYLYYPLYY